MKNLEEIVLSVLEDGSLNFRYSDSFNTRFLVEKVNEIKEYFVQNSFLEIRNIDDFKNLAIMDAIAEMKKNNNFPIEIAENIKKIFEAVPEHKINQLNINKYIKKNYKEILGENKYTKIQADSSILIEYAINSIFKNRYFFKDIIDEIEKNKEWLIINNIIYCEKYYKKYTYKFINIFNDEKNKHYFINEEMFYTFKKLSISKQKYIKEFLNTKAKEIYFEILEQLKNTNEKNFLATHTKTLKFLRMYKNKYFNSVPKTKIDELLFKKQEIEKKYAEKYSIKYHGKVNKKETDESFQLLIKEFENNNFFNSYFRLTHKIVNGKLISIFAFEDKNNKKIQDILNDNHERDSFFTFTYETYLESIYFTFSKLLDEIVLNPKAVSNFNLYLKQLLSNIDHNFERSNAQLLDLLDGSFEYLISYLSYKGKYNEVHKYECYSLSMFFIVLMEKVLRSVIRRLEKDLNANTYTLGKMLKTNNENGSEYDNPLFNVFDINLIKVMEFTLLKTQDSKIGKNLRNKLMHNINIKFKDLNSVFLKKILFLFLSTINSVYIFIEEKADK
ncbi:hypothetical protein ACA758_01465 [Mycoplasmopsis agassizii]|uniref:hypothetical protein n=1 Tax=Mycoplasmopsis agassizii TaxID=33922 RepID=UPI0035283979